MENILNLEEKQKQILKGLNMEENINNDLISTQIKEIIECNKNLLEDNKNLREIVTASNSSPSALPIGYQYWQREGELSPPQKGWIGKWRLVKTQGSFPAFEGTRLDPYDNLPKSINFKNDYDPMVNEPMGDAIRNITGTVGGNSYGGSSGYQLCIVGGGVFSTVQGNRDTTSTGGYGVKGSYVVFDASKVVPTSDQNHPAYNVVRVWEKVDIATRPIYVQDAELLSPTDLGWAGEWVTDGVASPTLTAWYDIKYQNQEGWEQVPNSELVFQKIQELIDDNKNLKNIILSVNSTSNVFPIGYQYWQREGELSPPQKGWLGKWRIVPTQGSFPAFEGERRDPYDNKIKTIEFRNDYDPIGGHQPVGDAIRNIEGILNYAHIWSSSGAFTPISQISNKFGYGSANNETSFKLDVSRVVPTADQNHPAYNAVRVWEKFDVAEDAVYVQNLQEIAYTPLNLGWQGKNGDNWVSYSSINSIKEWYNAKKITLNN